MGGAQIMLKWLRTGAWPKLTDVLTAIRQELQSVQPIDTASIRWEKDAEGMKAYYTGRMGGGEGLTVDEGGESAEAEEYAGPYALSFDSEKQKLIVKAGFAWLNGSFVSVVAAELTPETGYVCVCATMNEYGVWSTPVLEFAVPSATAYPVGYCDATEVPPPEPEEGEEPADPTYIINTLTPYMQPVAILFGTGDCMEELIPPEA